jgi:RecA-family ATPase
MRSETKKKGNNEKSYLLRSRLYICSKCICNFRVNGTSSTSNTRGDIMGSGFNYLDWKNTWDKYLTEIVTKIKVRWLKKDKDKLKKLENKADQLQKETDIAEKIYFDLRDKLDNVETSIYKLNNKYTYQKKIKIDNPYYEPIKTHLI